MSDPLSITLSAIPLVALAAQAGQSTCNAYNDFRNAERSMRHIQGQLEFLHANLENTAALSNIKLAAAKRSFEAIEEDSNGLRMRSTKRGRLSWAMGGQKEADSLITQYKNTELSASYAIQLETSSVLEQTRKEVQRNHSMTKRLQEQLEAESKLNSLRHEKLQRRIQSWAIIPSTKPRPHQLRARVEDWSTQVGNYIKLKAHLIVCEKDGKTEYRWAVRGPFTNSKMFHYSLTSSWPSWTDLSLYLRLRVQNIIPQNSKILTACQMDDVAMVTDLIQTGKAHPNDTTTESLTLIYFSIRAGSCKTVQLLLHMGADPNLCYGRFETSPLDTAFHYGHVEIVRMLLAAKSELEYINTRLWTTARYMYDPEQSNPHTIELLEICASNNFSLWDSQDAVGWTIMHRAAAFGQRRDIQKLVNLGASLNIFVHNLRWQPIHCSVRYGNESTFDYLASLMGASVLVALKDSRGWSLLHLAAEGGSEALIVKLLQFGLDPRERSDASTRSVPADLEMQELLPADIAKSCGNEQAFERAIAFWAAGYPTQLQET